MAFFVNYLVRMNIMLGTLLIEQLSHFQYLGCDISYKGNKDVFNKTSIDVYVAP